ncbi:MAG: diguanylate cyclase [Chitinivibrionales bacterium]|nr:diguanylate cyclase [Chitinivibrionales bacterium]
MNTIAFLSVLACGFYVVTAISVLRAQPKSPINRLFALGSLLLAWWAGCSAFLVSAPASDTAWFWYRLTPIGWTTIPAVLLHLFLVLSERRKAVRAQFLVLMYAPAAVFLWRASVATVTTKGLTESPLGWAALASHGLWPSLYTLYYLSYFALGLASLWHWARRSPVIARRRQTRVIIGTGIIAVGLSTITDRLMPMLGTNLLPNVAHLWLTIWTAGTWYAMARYNLMMMTPSVASEEILATMSEAVLLMGPDNRIISVNAAAGRLLQADERSLVHTNVKDLIPDDQVSTTKVLRHADLMKSDFEREISYPREDGSIIDLFVTTSTVYDRYGQVIGVVMILRDITLQKRAQERLAYLAHHDALTNLPNRLLLQDRLERTVAHVKRYGNRAAAMLLDLDRFKQVNDTLGHDHGDVLLRQVSERLLRCVRASDTVARMGGDEFVLILCELSEANDCITVAERVLAAFEQAFDIKGNSLRMTPSIGIALSPDHCQDADGLLRLADIAMYESKRRGRGVYTVFESRLEGATLPGVAPPSRGPR